MLSSSSAVRFNVLKAFRTSRPTSCRAKSESEFGKLERGELTRQYGHKETRK